MPTQMPSTGRPPASRGPITGPPPTRAQPGHAGGERADAGHHQPVGRQRAAARSAVTSTSAPARSSARCGRAQVAPSRSRGPTTAGGSQHALGAGDSRHPRVERDGVAQRPGDRLELGLDDVVRRCGRTSTRTCSAICGRGARRTRRCAWSAWCRRCRSASTRLRLVRAPVRPAGQVDGGLHERLVERDQRVAEPADAGLVAERLAQRLAERERGVLDGVVGVDLEVAARSARSGRSRRACRAAASMWSKNGTPVSTSPRPVPSRSSSTRTVRLLGRALDRDAARRHAGSASAR